MSHIHSLGGYCDVAQVLQALELVGAPFMECCSAVPRAVLMVFDSPVSGGYCVWTTVSFAPANLQTTCLFLQGSNNFFMLHPSDNNANAVFVYVHLSVY